MIAESSLEAFLDSVSTSELVSSSSYLFGVLRSIVQQFHRESEVASLSLHDLELAFGKSIGLGFSLWQHMAALERLSGRPEWIQQNNDKWQRLRDGRELCGLATTHLGSPKGAGLHGAAGNSGDYVVSGSSNWVTGCGFFDDLIIGFETEDEIVFALIPFPTPEPGHHSSIQLSNLSCLMSTATGRLTFDDYVVRENTLVSHRLKSLRPSPRFSSLIIPELGVAKAVLGEIALLLPSKPLNAKRSAAEISLQTLKAEVAEVEALRKISPPDLGARCHQVISNAVELLALVTGSAAIAAGSHVNRLKSESMLFDIVVQSEESLLAKIKRTGLIS